MLICLMLQDVLTAMQQKVRHYEEMAARNASDRSIHAQVVPSMRMPCSSQMTLFCNPCMGLRGGQPTTIIGTPQA